MIIERKPKSTLVEEVLNFKKDDKETVVEEVKPVEEEQKVVEGVVSLSESQEIIDEKVADLAETTKVKPAESVLNVKVEEKKCENCIECDDRKAVAEQVKKLKEEHIKHKITKKDNKYIIECFGKVEKKEPLKETWAGEDIIDDLVDRAKSNIADGADVDDAVFQAIDEGLIYNKDIYALLEHYGSIDTSTIIESYYDDLYSDVVSNLDIEESLKEEFTEKGKKMIKDAKEAGLMSFYDPYAGNFAFTSQDYKANEDKIKAFLDSHVDYALIKDNAKSYPGNDYLESSEDGIIYFVTNWGLDEDEIGDAEIIIAPRNKEIKEDKKELDLKTAIKVADDTVLDDTFGKDTAERKLAQEIKDDKSENLEEAKSSRVEQIKSKILKCLDRIGYNEKDFEEYFVIEEKEFVNDEGDKATHVQIRNDLVDFYEAEADGLITELDKIVEPGYFEPYDAYVWDAYIWENEVKENLHEDLEDEDVDDMNFDNLEVKEVDEPTVDEVDDEVVYFSTDEVKDVVEDVVDEIGDEMKDKEPEEVDVEEIIDEKITDAVEEKKEEESEDVEDDVSGLEDEEEISVDFSDDDISEEDAQFLESLEISNNYKNESKSEEQQKLDEELGEVVIKDDLGVAEDLDDVSDLDALVDMIK